MPRAVHRRNRTRPSRRGVGAAARRARAGTRARASSRVRTRRSQVETTALPVAPARSAVTRVKAAARWARGTTRARASRAPPRRRAPSRTRRRPRRAEGDAGRRTAQRNATQSPRRAPPVAAGWLRTARDARDARGGERRAEPPSRAPRRAPLEPFANASSSRGAVLSLAAASCADASLRGASERRARLPPRRPRRGIRRFRVSTPSEKRPRILWRPGRGGAAAGRRRLDGAPRRRRRLAARVRVSKNPRPVPRGGVRARARARARVRRRAPRAESEPDANANAASAATSAPARRRRTHAVEGADGIAERERAETRRPLHHRRVVHPRQRHVRRLERGVREPCAQRCGRSATTRDGPSRVRKPPWGVTRRRRRRGEKTSLARLSRERSRAPAPRRHGRPRRRAAPVAAPRARELGDAVHRRASRRAPGGAILGRLTRTRDRESCSERTSVRAHRKVSRTPGSRPILLRRPPQAGVVSRRRRRLFLFLFSAARARLFLLGAEGPR